MGISEDGLDCDFGWNSGKTGMDWLKTYELKIFYGTILDMIHKSL